MGTQAASNFASNYVTRGTPSAGSTDDISAQADMDYESQSVFRGKKITNDAFQLSAQLGYPVYGGSTYAGVPPNPQVINNTANFGLDANGNAFPADQVALADRTNNNAGIVTIGGSLDSSGTGPITFGGSIGNSASMDSGALTKSGDGTWNLNGANTYTGGTTVSAGTLAVDGTASANKDDLGNFLQAEKGVQVAPPPTLDQRYAELQKEVNNTKLGTGSLTVSGTSSLDNSGTATLSAANSYSGTTTISDGTVAVLGDLPQVTPGSSLRRTSEAVALTTPTAPAAVTIASGSAVTTGTLTGDNNPNAFAFSGNIASSHALDAQGTPATRNLASNYVGNLSPADMVAATNGPDYDMASNSVQALPRTSPIGGGGLRTRAITSSPAPTAASQPAANVAKNISESDDQPVARPPSPVQFPPSIATTDNRFSTFALNVSDASYRLALAALQRHQWPDPSSVRTEEFLNAFNYHDPAPGAGQACVVHNDLAQNPFEAGQNLLRVSFQTAATGRDRATPLRLTLLLDNSGSMTRSDRVATLQAAIAALGTQLRPGDFVSLVTFARTPQVRLLDIPAERFSEVADAIAHLVPDGGTNLEEALKAAYAVAASHQGGSFGLNAQNRVVLLTDGAANLGDVDPQALAALVDQARRAGIALDAYGVGWDGYDDTVLEALTRHSDGRYAFLNHPEDVNDAFAAKLAGALAPAALDVKLQIEFNPARVTSYRLMGYNNLRLTKEQFRDNTVAAGELAAAEQGTAIYTLVIDPRGSGPVGTARARFRDPATGAVREWSWAIPYTGTPPAFDQATPALRLAAVAAYFAEYLQQSPFSAEVTPARLLNALDGTPQALAPDPRPATLVEALTAASSLAGGN